VHIDLQRVEDNEKIRISIPLHFVGARWRRGSRRRAAWCRTCENDVEVSCLPKDLPEFIEWTCRAWAQREHPLVAADGSRRRGIGFPRQGRCGVAAIYSRVRKNPSRPQRRPERRPRRVRGGASAAAAGGDAAKKAEPAKADAKKEPAKKDAKK